MNSSDLRQEIDRRIAAADAAGAARSLADLWFKDHSASTAWFACSRYEQLRPKLNLLPYRLAILRSFTVEPMVPLLRAAAFSAGIDLTVRLSEFNAHAQEILDPASSLYELAPDAAILAVQTRDIAPDLWHDFSALNAEQVQAAVRRVTGEFCTWVRAFRQHSQTHLIIHNLEQPPIASLGILDSQAEVSQTAAIQQINQALRTIASEHSGVYVLDYAALVARYGSVQWHDERKWLMVRLPVAAQNLNRLINEWLRFLHPLTGKVAKAIVVDLDNTLWGGVIGEDGMAGIQLGPEHPGGAYQELQRALLDLYHRGIILAVCSKNNSDDAMEALQKHRGMLLKPEHFVAMRINWGDKSQNLREIAAELNIGVDSLAFVDDNPIERQQIRTQLPEVFVIELPNVPMEFARAIRECPRFERLSLSAEDRQRSECYQKQAERELLKQTTSTREDFYRSLQQAIEIAPLDKSTLPRISQLTNKTNQFNLTTRRYTEQQIWELGSSPEWNCFSLRVRDRFGDNGVVGVAITRKQDKTCEIDTLLMSCRVIGRTVETAFLSFLAEHARKHGAQRLTGWFLLTRKNAPARDFYSNHGFQILQQNGDDTLWELNLEQTQVACPEWIQLHFNGDMG
ncbi:MAG TPA: HAD-IIIC family phosphatase [Candidatus Elarobacter sp.]|nr:HAD-IIIC family phosphatase [Candidatus Elarobacter sp.]